jgi:PAT family beta-lactamase induction signal transducer AmpG
MIFSLLPFVGTIFFLTLGRSYLKRDEIYNVPIIGDLADLVKRTGWMALLVFAIVVSYRISDTTMGVMAMPLYIDLGYSKTVIGGVKGVFGISMLIFGAFAGSWSVAKIGMSKTMIFGAFVTIFTNLSFAWLATVSTPKTIYLFSTIGADNLAAGFSGSVFIAFMSILVNKKYSASQYALFSSLFALYGKGLAAFSGVLADKVDYMWFFVLTSVLGVPALIFVLYAWLNGFTDSINENAKAKSCL